MGLYGDMAIRCPRLGGEVTFAYCEREAGELPCRQAVRCWAAAFPVAAYLEEAMGQEAWGRFCGHVPQDRITMLLGHIEAARHRLNKD